MYALAPKEYDTIELSPPAKPTTIVYKKAGTIIRTVTITYEAATENIEKVVIS
jgi:hypothetical protein